MNLFKIGDMTLNIDRVNAIQDNQASDEPDAPAGDTRLRILFDNSHVDLVGSDAQVVRRWIRHNARNLAPRRSVDGEDLVSPEEQLQKVTESLVALIDRARPRDPTVRGAAHRLADMIEAYITGQLQAVPTHPFERVVASLKAEAAEGSEGASG